MTKPRFIGAPAVHTTPARIEIACYDNWGDFDDALIFLTSGGAGVVGDVAFVRRAKKEAHWTGIFNHGDRRLRLRASPNRIFFAIGEPPTKEHRAFHEARVPGAYVLSSDEQICRRKPHDGRHVLTPCLTRSWRVR